jgi:hypothetical protein
MKTLKSILTGIALLFICAAANAAINTINPNPPKADVVNIYIEAIAHGKISGLDNVLNEDMQYNMQRGENVKTLNKQQLLDYLKNSPGANSPVTTSTSVIADDDETYVVKVQFKYDDLVRTDVVTVTKAGGWQISKVLTSFK